MYSYYFIFFFSSRRRHTRCALVTGVQTCALPIFADRAIDAKVAQEEWDAIVAAFVTTVKQRRVAEGFEQAVDACGKLLAQHFPAAPGERNELPDHLIEL